VLKARLRHGLRLEIELLLQGPDLIGRYQAHRQSPSPPAASKAHQKQGPFPPPALPGFIGTTTLSDSRPARRLSRRWRWCNLQPNGSPSITRKTLPTCRAHYPGGSRWVRLSVASPSHMGLPCIAARSASACALSRPAQASLALRPAGSLGRPRRPLSQGSGPPVARTSRLPATSPTDNCLGGTYLHWCSAPSRRTANLFSMYVRPHARGRGIADALVKAALEEAKGNALQMHCNVVTSNDRARRLYEHHGSSVNGTEPRALKVGDRFL